MNIDAMNYLTSVREQYEAYPYPPRDPENEKTSLSITAIDALEKINHYCFQGRRDFRSDFRPLVAGGGTGDAVIFLAEQLRDSNVEVTYIDLSSASMEMARKRAEIRGLDNICWLHGSLLNLAEMDLPDFDYISCSGVLMALADPVAGLQILKSKLAPDGAIGIMVYGEYGRAGVYQMQELMRQINKDEKNLSQQIINAKAVLSSLPQTNWLKRSEDLIHDHLYYGDSGIYDLLLHSQDRAYTVPQIYEWLDSCDLQLVDFVENAINYKPEFIIEDPDLREKVMDYPLMEQQSIAELMHGNIIKHVFYCSTKANTIATLDDLDNVPFFSQDVQYDEILRVISDQAVGAQVAINSGKATITLQITIYTQVLLEMLNGARSLNDAFDLIREMEEFAATPPSNDELLEQYRSIFGSFDLLDLIYLRHMSVPSFKPHIKMVEEVAQSYTN